MVLAFLFSCGLSFGFQWLNAIHPLPIGEGASGLVATALAVSGPALAAIVLTWASGTSVRNWLRTDIEETRFAWWWLGLPLFILAITLAAFTLSGAAIPGLAGQLPKLLGYFAFHILIVGLLEELGWRGWLLRRLLLDRTPLAATFIVAIIWFAWHLPKLLSDPAFAATFALAALVNSIILTALWSRFSGRTALAAIAHGSFNAPILFMADQYPQANGIQAFAMIVAINALAALILIASNPGWWRSKWEKTHERERQV